MELKDRIFTNLATVQLEEDDKMKLAEELIKQTTLTAKILAHILAQSDARAMLLAGVDLESEDGMRKARQQQYLARGLAEAVEIVVDDVCATVEEKETSNDN